MPFGDCYKEKRPLDVEGCLSKTSLLRHLGSGQAVVHGLERKYHFLHEERLCILQSSEHSCALQAAGQVSTSVQWGAWGGSGMAVRTPGFMERMAKYGLGIVEPYVGIAVLAKVMGYAWAPLTSRFDQQSLFTGATIQQLLLETYCPGSHVSSEPKSVCPNPCICQKGMAALS